MSNDDNNNTTDDNLPPGNDGENPSAGSEQPNTTENQPIPGNDYIEEPLEEEDSELDRSGSSLGSSSGKTLFLVAVLLVGAVIILYYVFSDSPEVNAPAKGAVPAAPSKQVVAGSVNPPPAPIPAPAPSLPSAPPAPPPPPPPPPAPPPVPPSLPSAKEANPPPPKPQAPLAPPEIKAIEPTANRVADKRSAERMRSNMLLMDGNLTNPDQESRVAGSRDALNANDPNAEFANNAVTASETETVRAGKLTDLNAMIAQGKIINAVLETAINTDLPGTLRAIVSRDVFAEAGKAVLIPKGSRLIGTYNTAVLRGQKRVMVVWTRIIRPDGVDIMIGSAGVDSLGRAGVEGFVDNKYMESFSAAILTSLISIGVGVISDSAIDDNSTTTRNTDGSTTSTGSAGSAAASQAATSIGTVGQEIVRGSIDLRPTISVDQGTRVNVFVNKDLIFPATKAGGLFVE